MGWLWQSLHEHIYVFPGLKWKWSLCSSQIMPLYCINHSILCSILLKHTHVQQTCLRWWKRGKSLLPHLETSDDPGLELENHENTGDPWIWCKKHEKSDGHRPEVKIMKTEITANPKRKLVGKVITLGLAQNSYYHNDIETLIQHFNTITLTFKNWILGAYIITHLANLTERPW